MLRRAEDVARRTNTPIEFFILAAYTAAGAALGGKIRVRADHDWHVIANIYAIISGWPGSKKTPVVNAAFAPLHAEEAAQHEESKLLLATFEEQMMVFAATRDRLQRNLKDAKGAEAESIAKAIREAEPEAPRRPRLLVTDITPEMLAKLASENPEGLCILLDELASLFSQMMKKGREDLRQMMLSGWSSSGALHIERISRAALYVQELILSVCGGIQPDRLRAFIRSSDDGLLERFTIVEPELPPYEECTSAPDDLAVVAYRNAIQRCRNLDPAEIGARPHVEDFHVVDLTPDARAIFQSWTNFIGRSTRLPWVKAHVQLASVLAKLGAQPLKLGLITHVLEDRRGPLTAEVLVRAIVMTLAFFSHSEVVFEDQQETQLEPPELLIIRLVQSGEIQSGFTARTVKQRHRAGLGGDEVDRGLAVLVECGHLLPEQLEHANGTIKTVYHFENSIYSVNPDTAETSETSIWGMHLRDVFRDELFSKYDLFASYETDFFNDIRETCLILNIYKKSQENQCAGSSGPEQSISRNGVSGVSGVSAWNGELFNYGGEK
ncbi:DUF3987 domain-containing protein [Myxococcota bacterium]|nr:DUF3987 domain-containing protein [Myxococcota bacterium]